MARLRLFLLLSIVTFSLVSVVLLSPQLAQAATGSTPVKEFTFQGLLRDNNGNLINTEKDISLRLYTIPTGGSASSSPGVSCPTATFTFCVWQENQTNVGVVNGVFTIFAGNQTSLNRVDFTKALYLEVIMRSGTVGSYGADQVLSPRINMTATPFAISTERGNFGYFNGTQFLINQTGSTDKKTIFNITNPTGIGTVINIKSGATFKNVMNITADSLTSGAILNVTSGSGSDVYRNLVYINQNNTGASAAIGLYINQAGPAPALSIDSTSSTGTGSANRGLVNITAGSLVAGSGLSVGSTSGDATTERFLINITNTNPASALAVGLGILQTSDGDVMQAYNGTNQIYVIDDLGRVGIGKNTAEPTADLHIDSGTDRMTIIAKSLVTGNNAVNITAGSLSTGSALNIGSTSGNTAFRPLVNISNINPAATGTTVLKINQTSIGPAIQINSFSTGFNVINVTAGKLTRGSALNITSGSGSDEYRNLVVINQNNTGASAAIGLLVNQAGDASGLIVKTTTGSAVIRNLVNISSTAQASTSLTLLNLQSGSASGLGTAFSQIPIMKISNATGQTIFNVTHSGVTTVQKLKVNASASSSITLHGIYKGQNTTVLTAGGNEITVQNAQGGDVAFCSMTSGTVTNNPATEKAKSFFITVSNVTTDKVFINASYAGSGATYGRLPFPVVCIVFDITD